MKILVTGATGLLGINLVRRLAAEGHSIRILIRDKSPLEHLQELPLERVVGNILDPASVREAVADCEWVFHLAGLVCLSPFARKATERINIQGTQNVVDACCEAKVARLIHVSSIAAVGYGTLKQPATEDSEWNFADHHNPYNDSKRWGEERVLDAVQDRDLNAVIVNPGYVIGPYDVKPTSGRLLLAIARGRVPAYPMGGIACVSVHEVVNGMIQAANMGRTGHRYILGGENLSYLDLMTKMANAVGATAPRFPMHPLVIKPLGLLGDFLGHFWPRQFGDINSVVFNSTAIHHYVSSAKAVNELAYTETSVDAAIDEAVQWFRQQGSLPESAGR